MNTKIPPLGNLRMHEVEDIGSFVDDLRSRDPRLRDSALPDRFCSGYKIKSGVISQAVINAVQAASLQERYDAVAFEPWQIYDRYCTLWYDFHVRVFDERIGRIQSALEHEPDGEVNRIVLNNWNPLAEAFELSGTYIASCAYHKFFTMMFRTTDTEGNEAVVIDAPHPSAWVQFTRMGVWSKDPLPLGEHIARSAAYLREKGIDPK